MQTCWSGTANRDHGCQLDSRGFRDGKTANGDGCDFLGIGMLRLLFVLLVCMLLLNEMQFYYNIIDFAVHVDSMILTTLVH
jgi:hypothetical protein